MATKSAIVGTYSSKAGNYSQAATAGSCSRVADRYSGVAGSWCKAT